MGLMEPVLYQGPRGQDAGDLAQDTTTMDTMDTMDAMDTINTMDTTDTMDTMNSMSTMDTHPKHHGHHGDHEGKRERGDIRPSPFSSSPSPVPPPPFLSASSHSRAPSPPASSPLFPFPPGPWAILAVYANEYDAEVHTVPHQVPSAWQDREGCQQPEN